MNAQALRKIEAELRALIDAADGDHPIDPFAAGVIASRIGAQAEQIEEGLVE